MPQALAEMWEEHLQIPMIDAHFHVHASLARDDLFENLEDIIDACGLSAINVVSTTGVGMLNENLVTALCKHMYPSRVYGFAGLHHQLPGVAPESVNLAQQAELLIELGFDGFKMLEGKPSYRKLMRYGLDDQAFDGFYSVLESCGMPLVMHVADPWRGDAPPAEMQQVYSEAENVVRKHPSLNVIFAHFHFLSHCLKRAAELLEAWPNVSLDLTPGQEMYINFSKDPDKTREFFVTYQDRIILGTDNHGEPRDFGPGAPLEYWPVYKLIALRNFLETDRHFRGWHEDLRGIALDPPVLEKIYLRNFQARAGASPRPLDVDVATQQCETLIERARKYAIVHEILPELRLFLERVP